MALRSVTAALSFRGAALAAVLSLVTVTLSGVSQSAAAGPFDSLGGSWSGNGSILLANGSSERIRCRVSYDVGGGGNSVQQELRCASDSYKFDLSSNVRAQGNTLSGTWNETSRGIGGNLQGRVTPSQIEALVETAGFSATLAIATKGNQQAVSIRSQGDFREVTITLRKGGR